jgi:NTE family protein
MIKNLVFKGGGVRGIAYAGALQVLEEKGILDSIEKVAGTSAGAITAMLVALNYDAAGIRELISNLAFQSLEDGWDPLRLFSHYGLYAGDRILAWLETACAAKAGPNATFAELGAGGFKDLQVVATSLNTQKAFIFSSTATPSVRVAQAVRASMSIPLFYAGAVIDGIDDLFVDGGTVWNYPITLFDPATTLGLYLTDFTPAPCPKVPLREVGQYVKSLFSTLLAAQDIDINEDPEIEGRTMRIDALGISATDFSLTDGQKQSLYQSGVDCALKFLAA